MKCDFCGHEVTAGTVECPYCHYQFTIDAQVLTPDERDTFEGVTIEEDGSTASSGSGQRDAGQERGDYGGSAYGGGGVPPRMQVRSFGCGSSMLMTLLILGGVLALFFFLLPTFLVFAAIGAVVVFFLRLFM